MDTILCPNCKQPVEISQALRHQIKEEELSRLQSAHKKELEDTKEKALMESSKKIKEQFELQMKKIEEDARQKDERNKELNEQISKLFEEMRTVKREKDEAKLEMQKKLAEEEEKIRADAQKKAEEDLHLKMLAKDKQLTDTLRELEDTKRKLQQGSQQLQGEVFELELEELLRREFPNDKIEEVAKGVRGGDIIHEVWDRNGNNCGKILWEIKNTKTWSEPWVDKLKADRREITAEHAVIVSEVLPSGVETAKYYRDIWITRRTFFIGLACALRLNMIQLAMAKRATEGKKEKTDILYSYLSGTEFRLRIEAIIEAFTNMQTEVEKEKRYFTNKWARDEKNIRQVIDNTYGMHGDLKGIMGNLIPQIQGLELLDDGQT